MVNILVFMFGLIIGSFLNVCIYRLPKNESVVSPPSRCPHCKTNIAWYDNIPLLSYVLLLGRCRVCKARISPRYFLVELLTASLLVLLFLVFGTSPKFFAYSVLTCLLIVATFVDFEIQEIPDQVSIGGAAAGIILALIFPSIVDAASRWTGLLISIGGAVAGGGAIYLLGLAGQLLFREKIKRLGLEGAIGFGDVKLMAMVGAFLGWKLALFTFFIAPVFGASAGIILKLRKGADVIPYGPYLSLATLVAIFFGNRILNIFFYGIF